MKLILLFGIFVVTLLVGMPIGYGMAISTVAVLLTDPKLNATFLPQKMWTALDSFSFMAVPFFMLAGSMMEKTGITEILVEWARSLVGHLRGGLGHAAIVTGVVMAGVSGSANADTAALASMLVPMMREDGFDDGYSCALVASCGALGPIIPPSIMMVLYSGVCSIAIGKLFMAGFIPGLVIAAGYMIINILYARTHEIRREHFVGWKKLGKDTLVALPALVMPIIIIGGILSGIFTATESGAIACAYCLLYGLIRRTLSIEFLKKAFMDAVHSTTTSMLIVGFACVFGALATNYNMAKVIQGAASGFAGSPQMVLIFLSIILYIAGMFIDSNAVMFMLIPIFAPLIELYHYDPLYFAIVMILALVMGGLSPPVGLLMYIASSITGTDLGRVVRYIFRFIIVNYAVVILVIFIPQIALWLPSLM